MGHLSYLNRYFWKYRGRFLLGILFVGLANWFRVKQPQVIRDAMDAVVDKLRFFRENGGIEAHPEALNQIGAEVGQFGLLLICLALLMGVFMFFMRQTIVVMSRLIEYDLRKTLYAHYQRLDTAFYKRNSTGDLMSRISEDVSKVRMYLGPAVLYGIDLVFLFGLTITSMLRVSPTLTLWSLAPLPLLSVSIYVVSNIINRKSAKIQEQLAALTSSAQEVYSGIRVVKSYAQEDAMSRWFADQSEAYRQKSLELVRVDAFFFPLMMLMIGSSIIITIYVGGLQVVAGNITPGNIAEFVIYINMLTWPVTAIGWIASITQQAAASQKRINEFLDAQPNIVNPHPDRDGPLIGHIVFDNVSFRYPDTGILALDQVSFVLKPGEKMAIVGRTGSGKTTIAELLTRMYDVSAGRILIDGIDLREHNTDNLRRRIGYVPQDLFLFSDSVLGNIAFGKDGLRPEEARFYAASAAIHDEIEDLKDGYDTIVGERGVTLSGGQKQRISIARALAKQPDIVLLDDCLSAVDTRTEGQILGYLNEALADKTAIVITHRIYSSLQFDKIIVLDKGRIVENGAHDELIARQGYYAELFEKQTVQRT
ncbi:MAG: ABC transporter ATP-binding protein [Saprospiraceae bacterium]